MAIFIAGLGDTELKDCLLSRIEAPLKQEALLKFGISQVRNKESFFMQDMYSHVLDEGIMGEVCGWYWEAYEVFTRQFEAAHSRDSDGIDFGRNESCVEFFDDFDRWHEKTWDESKFENGVREFFSEKSEFGDILIKWWNDIKSDTEQNNFPEEMLLFIWLKTESEHIVCKDILELDIID